MLIFRGVNAITEIHRIPNWMISKAWFQRIFQRFYVFPRLGALNCCSYSFRQIWGATKGLRKIPVKITGNDMYDSR